MLTTVVDKIKSVPNLYSVKRTNGWSAASYALFSTLARLPGAPVLSSSRSALPKKRWTAFGFG